jgi:hypothetical protein
MIVGKAELVTQPLPLASNGDGGSGWAMCAQWMPGVNVPVGLSVC